MKSNINLIRVDDLVGGHGVVDQRAANASGVQQRRGAVHVIAAQRSNYKAWTIGEKYVVAGIRKELSVVGQGEIGHIGVAAVISHWSLVKDGLVEDVVVKGPGIRSKHDVLQAHGSAFEGVVVNQQRIGCVRIKVGADPLEEIVEPGDGLGVARGRNLQRTASQLAVLE